MKPCGPVMLHNSSCTDNIVKSNLLIGISSSLYVTFDANYEKIPFLVITVYDIW